MSPIQYPLPEELLLSLSGGSRTGRIVRWLLTEHVQAVIGGKEGWEITIHGKGDNISVAIKAHDKLK